MQTITRDDKDILVRAAYILRQIGERDLGDDVSNVAHELTVQD